MNLLKKLKSLAVLMFFVGFLASATLISCGKQADKEGTEHPAEGEEAEKSEHPEKKADEHPTEKADTTKTETQP